MVWVKLVRVDLVLHVKEMEGKKVVIKEKSTVNAHLLGNYFITKQVKIKGLLGLLVD